MQNPIPVEPSGSDAVAPESQPPVPDAPRPVETADKTAAQPVKPPSSSSIRLPSNPMMIVAGVILLGAALALAWMRFVPGATPQIGAGGASANAPAGAPFADAPPAADLPPLNAGLQPAVFGVARRANLRTVIPSRPRASVITYTVQTGDTLFKIADDYNLKPETLLWGNYDVLKDNPHFLAPKQVLNILPLNGVYYKWQSDDSLEAVAANFKVKIEDILGFAGNSFDLTKSADHTYGLKPGQWIVVPGGKRALQDWSPPTITRANPATASYYGAGSCGKIISGAVGTGTFVWPTTDHSISGYTYNAEVHPGIDIGGRLGNPIYAADSGVIVYAGWSNYGYGNLIVVDHGNGFQTAYGHLSAISVQCGQSVFQGGYMGAMGSTGNSSGPHLHFELRLNSGKLNPLNYMR
jgi:murein DD-endopeptidase MepM/ murein hydrolase activator NlpD